jgi:hypothetical protein
VLAGAFDEGALVLGPGLETAVAAEYLLHETLRP